MIVDLASERGGNCELTEPGQTVVKEGVTIVGDLNWPSTVAVNSSDMYAKNVQNIVFDAMDKEGNFKWSYEDEIVDGAMVCHEGEVHHPKVRELMGLPPLKKEEPKQEQEPEAQAKGEEAKADEEKPAEEKAAENAGEASASPEEEKKE